MDAHDEEWELPDTVPVKPKPVGRGLPVPPVIPLVAILGIFIGLGLGYRIAPNQERSPAPSSARTAALAERPTAGPTEISIAYEFASPGPISPGESFVSIVGPIDVVNPPAQGLTIEKLLAVLAQPGMWIPSSDVISARVAHYNQVSSTGTTSAQWVWVVVIRTSAGSVVNGDECGALGASGIVHAECIAIETTQIIILDYVTGEFLEAQSWPRA
jgi:hypothetical protein